MFEPIAIIGMGGIFPDAMDLSEYWSNILASKNSVKEVPDSLWSLEDYYDENPKTKDKTYSKVAAMVEPIDFDALEFGMSPNTVKSTAVEQLYGLVVAKQALLDAGLYGEHKQVFNKERAGVIMSATVGKPLFNLCHRTEIPKLRKIFKNVGMPDTISNTILERYDNTLEDWDEACNPGTLANVVAGRIVNRFDLRGTSCCVDAACASGLASVKFAMEELHNGNCDIMLAGGVNLDLTPNTFISFSKTPALSKTNRIRPFDANADGMVLGDGVGMIVLKRLSDAERDQDKIYAVIRGAGSSSDGRANSIYAPSKQGQILAIKNALTSAGFSEKDISLIEAHGTGTSVGDQCELEALKEIFKDGNEDDRKIVIGSVKGFIGHLRMAAGIASLIKTVLALNQQIYPPTAHIETPNIALSNSCFIPLEKPVPWVVNSRRPIRRAGVSAFGFGGTNYHLILEEYKNTERQSFSKEPVAIIVKGNDRNQIALELCQLKNAVKADQYAYMNDKYLYPEIDLTDMRIGFVVNSYNDLIEKIELSIHELENNNADAWETGDIIFRENSISKESKLTVLFPGQGSQTVNAVLDFANKSPYIKEFLGAVDDLFINDQKKCLSEMVYPLKNDQNTLDQNNKLLSRTDYTQPTLAAVNGGIYKALKDRGISGDIYIGHSFGELMSLWAAGAFDDNDMLKLAYIRGQCMHKDTSNENGMLVVSADKEAVRKLLGTLPFVWISNENSYKQTVIAGSKSHLQIVAEKADGQGIRTKLLGVSSAFHTPVMEFAQKGFQSELEKFNFRNNFNAKVIANFDSSIYENGNIKFNLSKQLVNPVKFVDNIETAYQLGTRTYIEVGNKNVLSGLVKNILSKYDDVNIISTNNGKSNSVYQFELACLKLAVLGYKIKKNKSQYIPVNNKKGKTSYKISSQYFYLQKKRERMDLALNKTENIFKDINEFYEKDRKADETMEEYKGVEKKEFEASDFNQNTDMRMFEIYLNSQTEKNKRIIDLLMLMHEKNSTQLDSVCNYAIKMIESDEAVFRMILEKQERILNQYHNVTDLCTVKPSIKNNSYACVEKEDSIFVPENKTIAAYSGSEKKEAVYSEERVESEKKEQKEFQIVLNNIIDIISEATGFPKDIIQPAMNLESELGVDSIQSVEILTKIIENYNGNITDIVMEDFTQISSILELAEMVFKEYKG